MSIMPEELFQLSCHSQWTFEQLSTRWRLIVENWSDRLAQNINWLLKLSYWLTARLSLLHT